MEEFKIEEESSILPVRIMHNIEQIWAGKALVQSYNYLEYEFETEQHVCRARAYLDTIHTVAIYGTFEKYSAVLTRLDGVDIDQRVLAYLRVRYAQVTILGATGYVPIA